MLSVSRSKPLDLQVSAVILERIVDPKHFRLMSTLSHQIQLLSKKGGGYRANQFQQKLLFRITFRVYTLFKQDMKRNL